MTTIRKYVEKKHYHRKNGGGSFYEWLDINFSDNKIEICQLNSIGTKKRLPKNGSGSCTIFSHKEIKVLIPVLIDIILKAETV